MAANKKHTRSLRERFEAQYIPEPNSGCWLWTGATNSGGYGTIKQDYRTRPAPRASWEIHHGPIPPGLFICHKCDNRLCVNPDHLFLGTPADNTADRDRKGRGRPPRGVEHGMARLSEATVLDIIRAQGKQKDIAKRFGVSRAYVSEIRSGRKWAHLRRQDGRFISAMPRGAA